jgi:hypothetical protein
MTFHQELEALINTHSKENGSHTPDFILAQYLIGCLDSFDRATRAREEWYGRTPKAVETPPNAPVSPST